MMLLSSILYCLSTLLPATLAVNLYVASYNNNITTLSLLQDEHRHYTLSQVSSVYANTNAASWLTLNKQNNVLYLVDEATSAPNGTLVSYRTSHTGQLTEIRRTTALQGGVYGEFFGDGSALAVPHYTGSALQTYLIDSTGHFNLLETFTFKLTSPGTVPSRQDSPHPHEAILDPTRQFLLVPDLGADLVRVYSINASTKKLTALPSLQAKAGSGPRHGAFTRDPIAGNYVFYLDAEIASTVTSYRVIYQNGGISFEQTGVLSSLKPGQAIPPTTTGESTGVAAAVGVSPDGSHLVISNRRDVSFPNTSPPSDAMSVFSISPVDGHLTYRQEFPSGGSYARQFSFNKAGNLVAVGSQESSLVAILERDTETGLFTKEVASIPVGGQITCVRWDE